MQVFAKRLLSLSKAEKYDSKPQKEPPSINEHPNSGFVVRSVKKTTDPEFLKQFYKKAQLPQAANSNAETKEPKKMRSALFNSNNSNSNNNNNTDCRLESGDTMFPNSTTIDNVNQEAEFGYSNNEDNFDAASYHSIDSLNSESCFSPYANLSSVAFQNYDTVNRDAVSSSSSARFNFKAAINPEIYKNNNLPILFNKDKTIIRDSLNSAATGTPLFGNNGTTQDNIAAAYQDAGLASARALFGQNELDYSNELPPSFQIMLDKKKRKENPGSSEKKKPKKLLIAQKSARMFDLGCEQYEIGNLTAAATYFKKSADLLNPSGLLFYGLCLRHGWGIRPNMPTAFVYLQQAAKMVLYPKAETGGKDELQIKLNKEHFPMIVYEIGMSYYNGWGVSKNYKIAIKYFSLSAFHKYPYALIALATSYERGDGVKKSRKKAALYFRKAEKFGISYLGNAWIYKPKFMK